MIFNTYETMVFLSGREYLWLFIHISFIFIWLLCLWIIKHFLPRFLDKMDVWVLVSILVMGLLLLINCEIVEFGFYAPYPKLSIVALLVGYVFSVRLIANKRWLLKALVLPIITYATITASWLLLIKIKIPINERLSGPVLFKMLAWDDLPVHILRQYFSWHSFDFKSICIITKDSWHTVYVTPTDFRKCWPENIETFIETKQTMSCAMQLYKQPLLSQQFGIVVEAKVISGRPKTMK